MTTAGTVSGTVPAAAGRTDDAHGPQGPQGPQGPPGARSARPAMRRWRGPLAVVLVIVIGGIIVALLQPSPGTSGYLDPGDPHSYGARALATLLQQRGAAVTRVDTVAAAASATRGPTTLLITSPELLTTGQLRSLARIPADLVIVAPDPTVLAVLAPGVTAVRQTPVRALAPGCGLAAARLAGPADLGGLALRATAAGARRCYPAGGSPTLVRYVAGRRDITVLGTGALLTNSELASEGNAALGLNLLGGRARLVWLVPGPPVPGTAGGQRSFPSLVPWPAYLVAIQLAIAAVLAALWRGRRLGPVVAERLPVVVRAAETVEGHGRLYHARRSRDRAAAALRDAARGRILRSLGISGTPDDGAVAAALSVRTGRPADEIMSLLAGRVPADDAALVALADGLDGLEREVRNA